MKSKGLENHNDKNNKDCRTKHAIHVWTDGGFVKDMESTRRLK